MRSLAFALLLASIWIATISPPAQAASVLITECTRLIALGQTDTAHRILLDVFNASNDTDVASKAEDRFEAAILLASFPPGTAAYKDRARYARFVLEHPLATSRLSDEERFRMTRTEGLGWFSSGQWASARKAFQLLATSENGDDLAIAALHLGWIEINQKRPAAAVDLWIAALEKPVTATQDSPWRDSIYRDLARAWVESGGISPGKSATIAGLASQNPPRFPKFPKFQEGLRSGLQTISTNPTLWTRFRAHIQGTSLRNAGTAILLSTPGLTQDRECELLAWMDETSLASQELKDRKETIERLLRACWESGNATRETERKQLLALLTALLPDQTAARQSPETSKRRIILADILLALGSFDDSCREYVSDLLVNPAAEFLEKGVYACRKATPTTAAQIRDRIPPADERYFRLLDAAFSVERDLMLRQQLLEKHLRNPSEVAKFKDPLPLLWWLDALNRLDEKAIAADLRETWTRFFLSDAKVWKSLRLSQQDQLLVRMELSRSTRQWTALYGDLREIEKLLPESRRIAKAYSVWLEAFASDLLQKKDIALPEFSLSWHSGPQLEAIAFIRSASLGGKTSYLPASRKQQQETALLRSAALFASACESLNKGAAIHLSLSSPRFLILLQRQLGHVEKGSTGMRKAVAAYPSLKEHAARLLNQALTQIQQEIAALEPPEDWPEDQKTLWKQQRVQLPQLLEQRKVL